MRYGKELFPSCAYVLIILLFHNKIIKYLIQGKISLHTAQESAEREDILI
jgi:hypothetical protein